MKKPYWKCRLFGHKWEIVYIGKYGKWKLIGAYCGRWQCFKGHDELHNFLDKTPHDFGTWTEKYFNEETCPTHPNTTSS